MCGTNFSMKKKHSLALFAFQLMVFGGVSLAQDEDIPPAPTPDDQELRKIEEEAQKFISPDIHDPYYEKNIKDAYEKEQDKKADEYIKQLKDEYGTEKFDLETLDKGPAKKEEEKKEPKLYATPPADKYYEENVKKEWDKKDRKMKQEIIDMMRSELGDEKVQKKKTSEGSGEPSYAPEQSDSHYEKDIKESWEKDKKDLLERVKKKLEDEKLIIKEEDKKSSKDDKGNKKNDKDKEKSD